MATSTPTPPDDAALPRDEAAQTPGHQRVLETLADQAAAIDELIGLARQTVRVFDHDLSETGWNSPGRAEKLARFLRGNPGARLEIIVHDTQWLERYGPRLANLLRQFAHAITIYRTGPGARSVMDPLVIVDGRHFLHRHHVDHPKATLAIDSPHAASPLVQRFQEIWGTGEPGLSATVLGI
jgi:hypothetical protein